MSESVYQQARRMLNAGVGWTAGTCAAVLAALDAGEKAERERDEARTALDAISVPDTIALLKQRAEKAEARVKELEAELGDATREKDKYLIGLVQYTRQCYFELTERVKKAEARMKELETWIKKLDDALLNADSILSLVAHRNSRGPLTEDNRNEMLRMSALCRRLYTSSPVPE
jgi:predicted RNase H-like nuclease (RuvC/YqgF family)